MPADPSSCPYPAPPPPVSVPLTVTAPHPCPYLPNRQAILRAFRIQNLPPNLYHEFLNASFRRSGHVIYQPACAGCRACLPLRIPVAKFKSSKSQRRCRRRNADLSVTISPPRPTDEKFLLYQRYQSQRHNDTAEHDQESFREFLYDSPVQSLEFTYRDPAGNLLAVGICDVCSLSLSSVYFWFDPDQHSRSLGTFGALCEIDFASAHGIPDYHLGYWVHGSSKMAYKANFHPHEILHPDTRWRPSRTPNP